MWAKLSPNIATLKFELQPLIRRISLQMRERRWKNSSNSLIPNSDIYWFSFLRVYTTPNHFISE